MVEDNTLYVDGVPKVMIAPADMSELSPRAQAPDSSTQSVPTEQPGRELETVVDEKEAPSSSEDYSAAQIEGQTLGHNAAMRVVERSQANTNDELSCKQSVDVADAVEEVAMFNQ